MKKNIFLLSAILLFNQAQAFTFTDTLKIKKTADFQLDGAGTNVQWDSAAWVNLIQLDSGIRGYDTKFKVLYSDAGVYVFLQGMIKKSPLLLLRILIIYLLLMYLKYFFIQHQKCPFI